MSSISLSSNNNNSVRNRLLDYLRALAIVMVVTVHTFSLAHIDQTEYPLLTLFYSLFFRWGVPLFVMISGALQLSAPISSIRQYYKKRYTRILVPFLIWGTMVYVLSCIIGKYDDIHSITDAVKMFVPYLLTGQINAAYWYITLIIVLYGLTPFLQRALQPCSKRQLALICLAWLFFVATRQWCSNWQIMEYTSRLTLFLGYYILGYFLYREYINRWNPKENKIVKAVSDCSYMTYLMHMIFISPFYSLIESYTDFLCYQYYNIILPFATTLIIVAICTISGICIKRFIPFYRYLGIC